MYKILNISSLCMFDLYSVWYVIVITGARRVVIYAATLEQGSRDVIKFLFKTRSR